MRLRKGIERRMETKKQKLNRKKAGEAVLFLEIMFLTFYTLLRGQNLG